MIGLAHPFRIAAQEDAGELAHLQNFAGEGIPLQFWHHIATANGGDPWEIGRARQAIRAANGDVIVADIGQGAVACVTGYELGAELIEELSEDTPALLRGRIELLERVRDSWFVNALACYPEYRGKGFGTKLLGAAEQLAGFCGIRKMSVIVANTNAGARRLYERVGYRETARRPCMADGWKTSAQEWLLLEKRV